MNWILDISEMENAGPRRIGGKGLALAKLARNGFTTPETICVTADAYIEFVNLTGLRERVLLELNRKDFNSRQCGGRKSWIAPRGFETCFCGR